MIYIENSMSMIFKSLRMVFEREFAWPMADNGFSWEKTGGLKYVFGA